MLPSHRKHITCKIAQILCGCTRKHECGLGAIPFIVPYCDLTGCQHDIALWKGICRNESCHYAQVLVHANEKHYLLYENGMIQPGLLKTDLRYDKYLEQPMSPSAYCGKTKYTLIAQGKIVTAGLKNRAR